MIFLPNSAAPHNLGRLTRGLLPNLSILKFVVHDRFVASLSSSASCLQSLVWVSSSRLPDFVILSARLILTSFFTGSINLTSLTSFDQFWPVLTSFDQFSSSGLPTFVMLIDGLILTNAVWVWSCRLSSWPCPLNPVKVTNCQGKVIITGGNVPL